MIRAMRASLLLFAHLAVSPALAQVDAEDACRDLPLEADIPRLIALFNAGRFGAPRGYLESKIVGKPCSDASIIRMMETTGWEYRGKGTTWESVVLEGGLVKSIESHAQK